MNFKGQNIYVSIYFKVMSLSGQSKTIPTIFLRMYSIFIHLKYTKQYLGKNAKQNF